MKKLYIVTLLNFEYARTIKLVRAQNDTDAVRAALHSIGGWAEWQHDAIGAIWNRENKFYIHSVEGEIEA